MHAEFIILVNGSPGKKTELSAVEGDSRYDDVCPGDKSERRFR